MVESAQPAELPDMPPRYELHRSVADNGDTLVTYGPRVLFRFDPADRGMARLSMVAISQAGVEGKQVAKVFGVRAEHVSRMRTRAFRHGSAALIPPMGAPRKLSSSDVKKAYRLADEGHSGAEIARRFSVSAATISRLLARRPDQRPLPLTDDVEPDEDQTEDEQGEAEDGQEQAEETEDEQEETGSGEAGEEPSSAPSDKDEPPAWASEDDESRAVSAPVAEDRTDGGPAGTSGLARLADTSVTSRYAGAMLLHPFLDRLGISEVLGALPAGPARRYDAGALVLSSAFGFALGISSLEGAKHLRVKDAGALVGLASFPHLRTLRPKLKDLAEVSDPLAIQRGCWRSTKIDICDQRKSTSAINETRHP